MALGILGFVLCCSGSEEIMNMKDFRPLQNRGYRPWPSSIRLRRWKPGKGYTRKDTNLISRSACFLWTLHCYDLTFSELGNVARAVLPEAKLV